VGCLEGKDRSYENIDQMFEESFKRLLCKAMSIEEY
jgi:hypothetical protein